MSRELTNLLPPSESAKFRRTYFLRLGTVAILLVTVIVIVHGIFLLPAYIYLNQEVNAKTLEINNLSSNLKSSEEQQAETERANLQAEATHLIALGQTPTASLVLQSILAVPRTGISISGLTYTPADSSGNGTLQITGTASTRETLRNYDQALAALPFVTGADLPISDYAADTNITFTITVTGMFSKIPQP